jgi:hypothetical protein
MVSIIQVVIIEFLYAALIDKSVTDCPTRAR